MIPRIIKSGFLANKASFYKFPKQRSLILSKLYSTEHNDTLTHDEQEQAKEPKQEQEQEQEQEREREREPEIWELPSSKSGSENPRTVSRRAKQLEEFNATLDSMIAIKKADSANQVVSKVVLSTSESDFANSERILTMIMESKTALYKKKKPLPHSAVGPMFGKSSQPSLSSYLQPDDPKDDALLDYLLPGTEDKYNWDQTVVSKNEHIVLKQEEMESAQAIVEAPTTLDLWHCIEREINRQDYPKYYPNVLTKAIEHARKMDPYMALTIFEKAKQKSIQSYISGCTVQVYNAMLLLRWEAWRDINGMLNLAEEMTENGIEFDNNSRRIVSSAVHEIEAEGGYLDEEADDGVFWNAEERRNSNLLKELAGKWMITK